VNNDVPWQVLIFGRPEEVLRPGCQVIRSMARFNVVAATTQPELAARTALNTRPHLLIIDATADDGVGIKLARRLRAAGDTVEIVTVGEPTLAFVRDSCHVGAIDIVTLPARADRFREAIDKFLKHMGALALMQQGGPAPVPGLRGAGRWLPKGISRLNVDLVRKALAVDGPATSSEIAATVGLARVTCRRYLEYLVTIGEASVTSVTAGPGRPRRLYEELPGLARDGDYRHAVASG
jgi:response regulator of citrate/malate metabolism